MLYEDYEGSRTEFMKLLAERGEEPAFVTRSRKVDATISDLSRECHAARKERLHGPRLHLRKLASAVGDDWSKLSSRLLKTSEWSRFRDLHEEFSRDCPPPTWTDTGGWLGSADRLLQPLYESVDRFNAGWDRYLLSVDLDAVNEVIEGYNNYYLLEKACAFGREDLAKIGFEAKETITTDRLRKAFPPILLPARR